MGLKRKNRISASFSMASMTDIIFLLLIFFMITSTFIIPNAIELDLPSSTKTDSKLDEPMRISLDVDGKIYVGQFADSKIQEVENIEVLETIIQEYASKYPESSVAIYADKGIPYKNVIDIVDIVSKTNLKLMLITNPK